MAEHHDHHHPHSHDPIAEAIRAAVAMEVERVLGSAVFQSDLIGRTMMALSSGLMQVAANYVVLRPTDILVAPEPLPNGEDAVFVTRLVKSAPNCCQMLARCYKNEETGQFDFDTSFFVTNTENTLLSGFTTPTPEFLAEIKRQLSVTCTSEGEALFGVVIHQGYFKTLREQNQGAVSQEAQPLPDPAAFREEAQKQVGEMVEQIRSGSSGAVSAALPPPAELL